MNKKAIYLFAALLVPVLIFMFLRFFGKNQFDIPIYFQNGVDSLSSVCHIGYPKPYLLPDSVLKKVDSKYQAILVSFDTSRLADKFISGAFESFGKDEVGLINVLKDHDWSDEQLNYLKECVFMLNSPWTVVLTDDQKRIRGYYHPTDQEETDRMVVELKILLKKY